MRQHPHKASKGPGAVTPRFPAERPSTSNCASSPARPHPPSRSAKWMGQKRQRSLDRRGDGLREVGVSTVTGLCAQPGQTLDAWLLPQARRIPSCLRVPGFFRTEPGLFCALSETLMPASCSFRAQVCQAHGRPGPWTRVCLAGASVQGQNQDAVKAWGSSYTTATHKMLQSH